jgi:hypothetical protein
MYDDLKDKRVLVTGGAISVRQPSMKIDYEA